MAKIVPEPGAEEDPPVMQPEHDPNVDDDIVATEWTFMGVHVKMNECVLARDVEPLSAVYGHLRIQSLDAALLLPERCGDICIRSNATGERVDAIAMEDHLRDTVARFGRSYHVLLPPAARTDMFGMESIISPTLPLYPELGNRFWTGNR